MKTKVLMALLGLVTLLPLAHAADPTEETVLVCRKAIGGFIYHLTFTSVSTAGEINALVMKNSDSYQGPVAEQNFAPIQNPDEDSVIDFFNHPVTGASVGNPGLDSVKIFENKGPTGAIVEVVGKPLPKGKMVFKNCIIP